MNQDSLQVLIQQLASLPFPWKWSAVGLLGMLAHLLILLKDKRVAVAGWRDLWTAYQWDIVWGIVSYWIIIILWRSGEMFRLIAWVGFDVTPFPVNALSLILGFFAGPLMTGMIMVLQYAGDKIAAIFKRKIDTLGDQKS
jgi:hypothetical protein